jgi:hypothetical protein
MIQKLLVILSFTLLVAFASCESKSEKKNYRLTNPNLKEVVVNEVIQTSNYTYLKLNEDGTEYWGAIPRNEEIKEGSTYYFDSSMEMKDFPSKELDRTFDKIYFIQEIHSEPFAPGHHVEQKMGSPEAGDQEIEPMDPVEGGITIGQLYDELSAYSNKTVKIRGIVVKYTESVMGKNWVHIQDGTFSKGKFDLTITTAATCDIGDEVTFEGKVVLNKDFGYGYFYEVLIEDAVLLEKVATATLQ